jgi:hypothetical protein
MATKMNRDGTTKGGAGKTKPTSYRGGKPTKTVTAPQPNRGAAKPHKYDPAKDFGM